MRNAVCNRTNKSYHNIPVNTERETIANKALAVDFIQCTSAIASLVSHQVPGCVIGLRIIGVMEEVNME